MNPIFFPAMTGMLWAMLGVPPSKKPPIKEPPTFPRSDMVEEMEDAYAQSR